MGRYPDVDKKARDRKLTDLNPHPLQVIIASRCHQKQFASGWDRIQVWMRFMSAHLKKGGGGGEKQWPRGVMMMQRGGGGGAPELD